MLEEIPEAIKKAIDRNEMQQEATGHELKSFLFGLNKEQLLQFKMLITAVEVDNTLLSFFSGVVLTRLAVDFDVCFGCGKLHHSPDDFVSPGTSSNKAALLEEYGLTEDDEGNLFCVNCKMSYTSLDDRMRRSANVSGCTGCVQKAQWG